MRCDTATAAELEVEPQAPDATSVVPELVTEVTDDALMPELFTEPAFSVDHCGLALVGLIFSLEEYLFHGDDLAGCLVSRSEDSAITSDTNGLAHREASVQREPSPKGILCPTDCARHAPRAA
jgi:hypothetical protein